MNVINMNVCNIFGLNSIFLFFFASLIATFFFYVDLLDWAFEIGGVVGGKGEEANA